jgi:dTDP-4-amino-4,6-dideoxygalactose transaminase
MPSLVKSREKTGLALSKGLKDLKGLKVPSIKDNCTHAFYCFGLIIDESSIGVNRETIIKALEAEGVNGLNAGYQLLHMLPMFQEKIAYGSNGFPWTSDICKRDVSYKKGICPVAEELHYKSFIAFEMCHNDMSETDVKLIIAAFHKVWDNLDLLK